MADYRTMNPSARGSTQTSRPSSIRSARSQRSQRSSRTSEATPLLPQHDAANESDAEEQARPRSSRSSLAGSVQSKTSLWARRWPSFVALLLLSIVAILIMLLGFFAPQVVEEYAMQAKQFELTSVSLPEFTDNGAKARIQGVFYMDPSKVSKKSVRNLGSFGTWIAAQVKSDKSTLKVTLPDYEDVIIGIADIPPIKVNIRPNERTNLDFLADLTPGDLDGIRKVADDWVSGRLQQLRLNGAADVKLSSGIISLGSQSVTQSLVLASNEIPEIPQYNITRLLFHEAELPDGTTGMKADVSLWVKNDYPIDLAIPPLGFDILVDNCLPTEPYIRVADARTKQIPIHPHKDLNLNVSGIVEKLPKELTSRCPQSGKSPLDAFLGDYIHGHDTTIYVKGSSSRTGATPDWLTDIISSITVPVPFQGHTFDKLIRNFSLTDVNFNLPDPFAEPDSPESNPAISATIKAYINVPGEMNFPIDVDRVRAKALVYYKGKQLGHLDLHKWQEANSTNLPGNKDEGPAILVESNIENAPLEITDQDVFAEVVQKLFLGGRGVELAINADVDVEMETALGSLTVREIPAEGVVPINPMLGRGDDHAHGGLMERVRLRIGNLQIVDTSPQGLVIQTEVNFTNPTNYSANVPFLDIMIETNGTSLGHAKVRNTTVVPGNNTGIIATGVWEPFTAGGKHSAEVGRELLSQYISGLNTTLTFRTFKGSIPNQPSLGEALSNLSVTIPTPSLSTPSDSDDPENGDPGSPSDPDDPGSPKKPHFIKSATMHLLSSTAVFRLLSPLRSTTLYITSINATAFYKDDDVGRIEYDLPFAVTPGESESPRLPVEWSLGSVGYEAVRKALGGSLRLRAVADVGVRIGRYEIGIWFRGGGIGAGVRL